MGIYRPRLTKHNSPDYPFWEKVIKIVSDIGAKSAVDVLARSPQIKFESANDIIESVRNTRIKTLDDLLAEGNVDLEKYEVDHFIENKWEVGAKDPDGNLVVEPLWQVKAWLKIRGLHEPNRHWTEKWLDKFAKRINRKPKKVVRSDNKPIVVVLGDLHYGYIGEDFKIIPDYNEEICRTMLQEIATNAKATNRPVIVLIAGDLIESFSGKNKADTWKQITKHGMQVVLGVYDVLEEFFSNITHFEKAYVVSGNHDRISDTSHDDPYGQVAEAVVGMFNRIGQYDVEYDPLLFSIPIDGINYILTHGDKRITKTNAERLIIDYGRTDMFNMIINAHLHGRAIKEDALKYRVLQIPSLITGTKYEERNGWNSMSGYYSIECVNGKPKVTDFPL